MKLCNECLNKTACGEQWECSAIVLLELKIAELETTELVPDEKAELAKHLGEQLGELQKQVDFSDPTPSTETQLENHLREIPPEKDIPVCDHCSQKVSDLIQHHLLTGGHETFRVGEKVFRLSVLK